MPVRCGCLGPQRRQGTRLQRLLILLLGLACLSDESYAACRCNARVHFRRSGSSVQQQQQLGKTSGVATPVLDILADATVFDSFEPSDFCGEPATKDDFDPPNLQSAILTKLEPGALYEYQIGHHGSYREFRAPPETGPDASFSFVTYGDMGESMHKSAKSPGAGITAARVAEEIVRSGAELVVHVGDISYADGRHKIWQSFLETIEPYASRAPYQISVGNHEYDYKRPKHHHSADPSGRKDPYHPDWGNYGNDSGGECGLTVSKLFLMPRSRSLHSAEEDRAHHSNPPFWFSYDYGSVHFVTISTEHDLTKGSPQYKWLELALAAIDRCSTPWVVLLSHRPMYVVHPHKSNRIVGEHIRKSVEPLIHDYGVDLVLSGHVHAYARTCAVHKEHCTKVGHGGAYHVTLGCGGRKLSSVTHTQPDWLEYAELQYGFGRVTVQGAESLLFEYVLSETGEVRDAFMIHGSDTRRCGAGGTLQGHPHTARPDDAAEGPKVLSCLLSRAAKAAQSGWERFRRTFASCICDVAGRRTLRLTVLEGLCF